jgi:Transposase IS4
MAFKDCLRDTVKLKNKPIDTGYKLWCVSDHGYIWSWLFHLRIEGVKTFEKGQKIRWPRAGNLMEKSTLLAPIFALVLRLTEQLSKHLKYCIYLNNLFLNLPVAQCLLSIGIYYIGTTRKKAVRVSL